MCRSVILVSILSVGQVSAFYAGSNPPTHLVRFCFCKTDEKLSKAADLLEAYFGKGAAVTAPTSNGVKGF